MRSLSSYFIDDALFYLFTIVPLTFFFGAHSILLLGSVHIASAPFSAIAHGETPSRGQIFFITIATVLCLIADSGILLFGFCQLPIESSDVCKTVDTILGKGENGVVLAFFMSPVASYNLIFAVVRLIKLTSASKKERAAGGIALIVLVKLLHLAALATQNDKNDTIWRKLLVISVTYSLFASLVSAANWFKHSEEALVASFFADGVSCVLQTVISFPIRPNGTHEARESVNRIVLLSLAIASLTLTTITLLFYTVHLAPVNAWTKIALMAQTSLILYIFLDQWMTWTGEGAALFVAYALTTSSRVYMFAATDSLISVVTEGILFSLVDIAAFAFFFIKLIPAFSTQYCALAIVALVQCLASLFVAGEQRHLILAGRKCFVVKGGKPRPPKESSDVWYWARRSNKPKI